MAKQTDPTVAFIAGKLADAIENQSPDGPRAPKIFIADNSRLRPEATSQRDEIRLECRAAGLAPEFPSEHFLFPTGLSIDLRMKVDLLPESREAARPLRAAWRKIGSCAAVVAEVTPFRGLHLNPVIAFELGVAVANGLPIFAWTAAVALTSGSSAARPLTLAERVFAGAIQADGYYRDYNSNLIEDFDLVEFAVIAGNFQSVSTSRAEALQKCAEYLKPPSRPARSSQAT